MTTPNKKLVEILQPAYCPCPSFKGPCRGTATWKPSVGHVPRAFIGALGRLSEIKVVILVSEPGDPHNSREIYRGPNKLEQTCEYTFYALSEGTDRFHKRLKQLLDRLFPEHRNDVKAHLRKSWITQTYLCSAPKESGCVPRAAEDECAKRYLTKQLDLLRDRPVIALGCNKAYRRAQPVIHDVRYLRNAWHPSARKSNADFEQSYSEAAEWARAMF